MNIIDNPVNVRESASMDAPSFATLDVGTELSVLGPDTTGPDGTTRWVHVAANGRGSYVRSDLVSAPHAYVAATATPIPPTAIPAPTTPVKRSGAPVRVGSGGLSVVLYRFLDPAPVGNAIGPPAGSRAVAFDIEVENTSRSPQGYNALYAYLKDTNNRRYDVNFFGADITPLLTAGTNQPGECTRGWIVFVIPSNATVAQIGYEDVATGSVRKLL